MKKYLFMYLMILPSLSFAKNISTNDLFLHAGIGPGATLGGNVDHSEGLLNLNAMAEYMFTEHLGGILGIDVQAASTLPIRVLPGVRYRFDLPNPSFSPYVQAQFSAGRIYRFDENDYTYLGIRTGAGLDYVINARWMAGFNTTFDLGTALSHHAYAFGTWQMLFTASFKLPTS